MESLHCDARFQALSCSLFQQCLWSKSNFQSPTIILHGHALSDRELVGDLCFFQRSHFEYFHLLSRFVLSILLLATTPAKSSDPSSSCRDFMASIRLEVLQKRSLKSSKLIKALGLDVLFTALCHFKNDTFFDWARTILNVPGHTRELRLLGTRLVMTDDADNIKALMSTQVGWCSQPNLSNVPTDCNME